MTRIGYVVLPSILGLALSSCSSPPSDAVCWIAPSTFRTDAAPPARMHVRNRQLWCSFMQAAAYGSGNEFYPAVTLTRPPSHGEVRLRRTDKGAAVVWYKPAAGYTGDDSFDVEFSGKGSSARTVLVTVTPG